MMRRVRRFACIDWSGARGPVQPGIALALCEDGDEAPRLVPPPAAQRHWSRLAVLDWLRMHADDDLLVGIDFSASLPFADRGAFFPGNVTAPADARALWRYVDEHCRDDPHLACTRFVERHEGHFRVGQNTGALFPCPDSNGRLRETERRVRLMRFNPCSSFNLVGAAQVGRSSLTGMRLLHRLDGCVPIWPFDPRPNRGALIVEIYTSIAAREAGVTGGSKIRSGAKLDAALEALGTKPHLTLARYDDHATDAMLTAAWLRCAAERVTLWHPANLEAVAQTEGWTFGVV